MTEPPYEPTKSIELELSHRAVAELNHAVAQLDEDPDTIVTWLLLNCSGQAVLSLPESIPAEPTP
jgi:hypothetical protein